MFCTKYKKEIEELKVENETLKAKVAKGQDTVDRTNAYYKAKIAEIRGGKRKRPNKESDKSNL